jgi:choline dehydrogenase-like flavoprotein
MLSGIGPEDELRPHGIDVKLASPGVGQNLQEHIWATVMFTVNVPSLNMETTPQAIARHGLNFVVRGRGAVATPAAHAMLFGQLHSEVATDEEWIEYFRTYAYRGEHPAGTCRMGTDKLAVVDPQLKVRGVDGLRVVDTSVMPTLTSGHTNAPTIMIAERASDFIRAEANAR